ncbi:MAG: RluA family pseudouridine synthase [Phycisphaerales bacterium]|nr:RluA family pseudouridine synthase [Phycisphaerales bacterium]
MSESGENQSPETNLPNLILPGGKVDPDAVRAAYQHARENGDDDFVVRVCFEISRASLSTRLDKYLTTRVTFMSRNQLQTLMSDGGATVNGKLAKSSTKLKEGDRIELVIPKPPSSEIQPDEIPLAVLFEDDHMLVLNKDPDIIVHPARSENRGTMVNALAWHFANITGGGLSSVGKDFARPGVVHRLDRNTSGCIVFAKSDQAHWKLGTQFQDRKVNKRYFALVHGWVEPSHQVIDYPLGPHQSKAKGAREKRVVRHDELGKPSVTICSVRERYELPPAKQHLQPQRYSLVELDLKTGRTHQIRVHLAHQGFPIVGDDMYGGRPFLNADTTPMLDRQALHAALLEFSHPITEEPMKFIAPIRDEFLAVIEYLREHGSPKSVEIQDTIEMSRIGL